MAQPHKIAGDKNFSLTKIRPANEVERQIKEVMQRAFWDLLGDQLSADPPQYTHALQLLAEIKGMLYSVLLPQHEKLKEKIEGVLDLQVIEQQVSTGTLEFPERMR